LKEEDVFNAGETHFVIDQHNDKTLGRRGDDEVKYADVVSGDEGMTMMVLIAGGPQATICPPFLIFKNPNSFYPIRGVPDVAPGVSYRTGPKAWIDSRVFSSPSKSAVGSQRCPTAANECFTWIIVADTLSRQQSANSFKRSTPRCGSSQQMPLTLCSRQTPFLSRRLRRLRVRVGMLRK